MNLLFNSHECCPSIRCSIPLPTFHRVDSFYQSQIRRNIVSNVEDEADILNPNWELHGDEPV